MDGMEIIDTVFGSGIRITKPIIRDRKFILKMPEIPDLYDVYNETQIASLQMINGQYELDPGIYLYQKGDEGLRYSLRVSKNIPNQPEVYGLCILKHLINIKDEGLKIENLFLVFDKTNNHLRFSVARSEIAKDEKGLGHGTTNYAKNYDNTCEEEIKSQRFDYFRDEHGKEYFSEEEGKKDRDDAIERLFGEFRKCRGLNDTINIEELYLDIKEAISQKER